MMISTVTVRDSEMAFVKASTSYCDERGIDNKDGRAKRDGYAISESTKESGNTVGRCNAKRTETRTLKQNGKQDDKSNWNGNCVHGRRRKAEDKSRPKVVAAGTFTC